MKWFHAIGVCGHATSQVAVMFKKMGWFVTGSDLQFFPPGSDLLKDNNIHTIDGYSYEHLTKEFWIETLGIQENEWECGAIPDLCLTIDTLSPQNKEILFANKRGIDARPYAQILGEYLVKPESIVFIGSAGKTTSTALMVNILKDLVLNPSYMIGAPVIGLDESLKNTDSDWSVMEGDEYHNPQISRGAKFLEYKPKYLVITKISWEHQDIFSTQERYTEEFAKAVRIIPEDGLIVAKYGDDNIDKAIEGARCKVIRYKIVPEEPIPVQASVIADEIKGLLGIRSKRNIWSVYKSGDGKSKVFDQNSELVMEFETSMLGDYNLENILACVALISNLPAKVLPHDLIENGTTNLQTIARTIFNFKGAKKRLELLLNQDDLIVVDDFGVVPERAENSLKTLKEKFPNFEITAVFEPNAGSRPKDEALFKEIYSGAFGLCNEVIIPDLSDLNIELASTQEVVSRLKQLEFNVTNIPAIDINKYLKNKYQNYNKKQIFIFFSSYRLTSVAKELARDMSNLSC